MQTNTIIEHWRQLKVITIYDKMVQDAKVIQCVKMNDALTGEQLKFLHETYHPEQKQCYRNSFNLVSLIAHPFGRMIGFEPGSIKYIDGYVYEPGLLPIEHAFVRIGDKYIDPTFEKVLNIDVTRCEYVSLVELELQELIDVLEERGYHGPIYQYRYKEQMLSNKPPRNRE